MVSARQLAKSMQPAQVHPKRYLSENRNDVLNQSIVFMRYTPRIFQHHKPGVEQFHQHHLVLPVPRAR